MKSTASSEYKDVPHCMWHKEDANVAISIAEQVTLAASHWEQWFAGVVITNKDSTYTGTGWNNALLREETGQNQLQYWASAIHGQQVLPQCL